MIKKMVAIRLKTDPPGKFIATFNLGEIYRLPKGIKNSDIIREVLAIPQDSEDIPNNSSYVSREYNLPPVEAKYSIEEFRAEKIFDIPVLSPEKKEFRQCKKCNVPMTYIAVCCDDKASGVIEKWKCEFCNKLIVVKNKE